MARPLWRSGSLAVESSGRKGGNIWVPGVYVGVLDKVPFGAAMNKGLSIKTSETHLRRYTAPLLDKIGTGEIDLSFIITHRLNLADAPAAYETFRDKKDGCLEVLLQP